MVRKTIVSVSVAGLLAASSSWEAYSLGIGGISLKSGLNQPFKAEIPLHAVRENSLEDIKVKLAPSEDFFRAGLDRALVLSNLRFRPLRKETGETVIEVTSQGPIREPFLDFLVAVTWPQGHLLREYTVLLDPPFLMEPGPAIVSSIASVQDTVAPVTPQKAETWSVQIPEPIIESTMVSSTAKADSSTYGPIRPAETLWPIAQRVRSSSSIAPQQMMLALLRANPDVFLHGNINGLKVGRMLTIPAEEEALKLTFVEAVEQVQQQNKAWAALGRKSQAFEAERSEEEKAPGNESEGAVNLLAVREHVLPLLSKERGPGVQESSGEDIHLQTLLSLTQEALETRAQENEALQARLQAMELQVNTLQQLLSAQDARLVGLEGPEETSKKEILEGQDGKFEKVEFLAPSMEEIATLTLSSPGEEEALPSSGEKALETALPVSSDALSATEERVPEQTKQAGEFVSVEEVSEPEGAFSAFMNLKNFLLLGGSSVLLLILAVLRLRKRKTTEKPALTIAEQEEAGKDGDDEASEVLAKEIGPIAPLEQEVVHGMKAPASSTASQIQAESHEIMAEVDDYLAFGRHHEAATALKEALLQEPGRQDLKFKLAEVYHAAGNGSAFVDLVEEWAPNPHGDDGLWADLVAMGKDLRPGHALFTSLRQDDAAAQVGLELPASDFSLDFSPGDLLSDENSAVPFSPAEEEASAGENSSVETPQAEEVGLEFDLEGMVLAKPSVQDDGITDQPVEAEREEGVIEFEPFSSPLGTEENVKEAENSEQSLEFFSPEFEIQEDNQGLLVLETPVDDPESTPLEPADPAASVDTLGEDMSEASLPGKALLEDLDEMEVKLDLARAYMDMGDADGARGLLEEVVAEGTEQQRDTGEGLLAELAKAS
ncbi:FimV/HubP family polar landmark protein [Nitrosococcus oceani]|uniref:FimV/HubP family polar landmark protein n=1 Tax=Nitrosococcus oceani TaxID=1229 RepID=UPI0004E91D5A|nr:FimV/HubP family polar landmark protein [Nitrosococcus oceani]KFI23197.1 fimbrial protein FimV [Nitrosococcus oceani]